MTEPNKQPGFIERLARHTEELTSKEREIADALARDYPSVLFDSATKLAAKVGVSASTMVRMFAKLGYESYDYAQREARDVLTANLPSAAQRAGVTLGGGRSLRTKLDDVFKHDVDNLTSTFNAIDPQTYQSVVALLANSKGTLYIRSEKTSAPVGAWLGAHLNMCRPRVVEFGAGAISPIDSLTWITAKDVLLTFSIRRYSNVPVTMSRIFRERGASVIAITDSPTSPLIKHATHHLLVRTANPSPFDSYTAAFFLCNALVAGVAHLNSTDVISALQSRDEMWKQFENDPVEGPRRPSRD